MPAALLKVAAAIIVVAALYAAREFFIPLALAVLVSFVLAPAVGVLERRRIPTVIGSVFVVTAALVLVGVLAYFVAASLEGMATSAEQYRENLKERIRAFTSGRSVIEQFRRTTEKIEEEIEEEEERAERNGADGAGDGAAALPEPTPPIPVEVRTEESSLERIAAVAESLLDPLVKVGIVLVFVLFFLINRRDLRDRVLRLFGRTRLTTSTEALDDAARRVSRFLLVQLLINATYGIPVAVGLAILGVPGAIVWGVLAIFLRFIPYVGPWLSAGMPILLSLAVFPGWTKPAMVAGLFVVLELFSNNVMEPWLHGQSTGMTSTAVIVAAVFWGWLWGPLGLMLAVPLTAVLVAMGRYIPQFGFFTVLFGDEPALTPAQQIYHRLLASDRPEATAIADRHRREHGLAALFDDLLLPSLRLAERDWRLGRLPIERWSAALDLLESIVERVEADVEAEAPSDGGERREETGRTILVLPARGRADHLAGRMLAAALRRRGDRATVAEPRELVGEMAQAVEEVGARHVVLSILPPGAVGRARYVAKRFRRIPGVKTTVAPWGWRGDRAAVKARLIDAGAHRVAFTVAEILDRSYRHESLPRPLSHPA